MVPAACRRGVRSVLLAAAAGILACADPTAPLSSSAAIIYSLRSSGDVWADLYLIGPDGTRSRPFSSILGEKINPTWSPDGRTLAFMADVMYVANGDRPRGCIDLRLLQGRDRWN